MFTRTVLVLTVSLLISRNAYAYLDPGSGSYILQLIIAGLLTVGFTIKSFGKTILLKIRTFFSKERKK